MRSNLFLIAFLCITSALGISITNQTYFDAEITVNDGMNIRLLVYTVDFDQDVFIGSTPISHLSLAPFSLGVGETFPTSMVQQMGATSLVCPCQNCGSQAFPECNTTQCVYSSQTNFGSQGPPSSLIPLPATQEPLFIFFSVLAGTSSSSINIVPIPNRVVIAKISKYYDPSSGAWINFMPASVNFSTCKVRFENSGNPWAHVVNSQGQAIAPLQTTGNFVNYVGTCNSTEYGEIADLLMTAISTLSQSNDSNLMKAKSWALTAYMARDSWLSCTRLATNLLVYGLINRTLTGDTGCHFTQDQTGWALDPCCNSRLGYSQCCVPKTIQAQELVVTGFDSVKMSSACGNPDKAGLVIKQYVLNSQQAQQCDDQAKSNGFDINMWDTVMRFVQTCNEDVFGIGGQAPACKTNEDCWTNCDTTTGQCLITWDDQETPLIKCFVGTMDVEMERYLRKKWGLKAESNHSTFLATFRANMMDFGCKGPQGWQFNEQWVTVQVGNCSQGDQSCSCFTQQNQTTCQKTVYVPGNHTQCLALSTCNWSDWPTAPNATICVNKSPSTFCGDCHGDCWDKTVLSQCGIPWIDQTRCLAMNGTNPSWNRMWCILNLGINNTACIPTNLCPPAGVTAPGQDTGSDQCQSTCYVAGVNQTGCLALSSQQITPVWDTNLRNNATGLCRLQNLWSEGLCLGFNHTGVQWFHGRFYQRGWFDTNATCATGQCSLGSSIRQEDCQKTSACTQPCRTCESKVGKQQLCFRPTNGSTCASLSGVYITGICTFDWLQTQSTCQAAGHTFESCQVLSTSSCSGCETGQSGCGVTQNGILQCRINPWGQCINQTQCESSGFCDDWDFNNNAADFCRISGNFNTPNCTGTCLMSYTYDFNGNPQCAQDSNTMWSRMGCVQTNITNSITCASNGGTWTKRAFTNTDCLGHGSGCYERRFWGLTNKTQDLCTTCGGLFRPYYKWTPGVWLQGTLQPLSWTQRAWGSINKWDLTLNWTKMNDVFNEVVSGMMARQLEAQYRCKYGLISANVRTLACDCGDVPGIGCYSQDPSSTPLGVFDMFSDLAKSNSMANVYIGSYPTSVPGSADSISVTVNVVTDLSFIVRNSGWHRLGISDTHGFTIYEVVFNNNSAIVGQLAGAGVNITLSSHLADPILVCLVQDTTIEVKSIYNVPDFGVLASGVITPLGATALPITGQLCVNVTTSGFFFPIYRVDDWMTVDSNTTAPDDPSDDMPIQDPLTALWITLSVLFFVGVIVVAVFLAKSAWGGLFEEERVVYNKIY